MIGSPAEAVVGVTLQNPMTILAVLMASGAMYGVRTATKRHLKWYQQFSPDGGVNDLR